jgi:hypothetical protein
MVKHSKLISTFCHCAMIAAVCPLMPAARAQNLNSPTQYYVTPTPAPKQTPAASRAIAPAPGPARATSPVPASPAPTSTPTPVKRTDINDIARFLAGLPPEHDAELAALAQSAEWTAYAAYMNNSWPRFDYVKLSAARTWSAQEFAKKRVNTVFYPFSGPDFIFVQNMFPEASTYILCGLEPVGDIPSVGKLQPLVVSLGWLQASFKTLFNAGYFVTADMGVELKMSPLQGTLPLMLVMLARSGDRITSVSTAPGFVEIRFAPPNAKITEHSLFYFSSDLSNGGFGKGGALLNFLRKTHPDTAYIKSASYLMHEDDFSAVRNYLLAQMNIIVQDDSGIPLRSFDSRRWTLHLFGSYTAPLDIFAKYYQKDLADLYAKTPNVPPLAFGAGYHWDYKDANLMVGFAKAPAAQAATPAQASAPRLHR